MVSHVDFSVEAIQLSSPTLNDNGFDKEAQLPWGRVEGLYKKLRKLKFRREQHLLNFMYDQAQNPRLLKVKPSYAINSRSSHKKLLKVRRPRTEKFKKSLAYQGPKKWNGLPDELHHTHDKCTYKRLVCGLISGNPVASGATGTTVYSNLL